MSQTSTPDIPMEPRKGASSSSDEVRDHSLQLIDETLLKSELEDKVTPYLCFLISIAAIAGFLFGFDTAVVGVALPIVGDDLGSPLTHAQQEIVTSATTIGAIFGSAILGGMADKWGRKWCILIADIFFTIGAVIIASSYSLGQIIVGRLLLGVGVGGASIVSPLFITEIAPTAFRGRCIAVNAFFIPFGQVVAAAFGAAFQNVTHGWRILFALGVIPSAAQLLGMHWLPESPRVLILRGQNDKAREIMKNIYRGAPESMIDFKMRVAEEYVAATTRLQRSTTFWQRTQQYWTNKAFRRSIITVSGLQFFGQMCGYNTLLYYAGNLFGLLGLSIPALGALIPAGVNGVFVLVGMATVDKVGRRGLLMWGLPIMIAGEAWCVAAFYFLCKPTGGLLETGYSYDSTNVAVVIVGIVIFVVAFGLTYSHLVWYQSEFLALEIRAAGSAIASTTCWVANLIVSVSFLSQLQTLTPAGTYGYYLCLVIAGYIFVIFCYPESKGLSIDEIYSVFSDGYGVQKSIDMRKEKLVMQQNWEKERATEAGKGGQQNKARETAHLEFGNERPTRGFREDMST